MSLQLMVLVVIVVVALALVAPGGLDRLAEHLTGSAAYWIGGYLFVLAALGLNLLLDHFQKGQTLGRRFRRRRLFQILLAPLAGVCSFLLAGMADVRDLQAAAAQTPLFLAASGVLALALLASFLNWRCPACHRFLGSRPNPKSCPACGVPFTE